MDLLVLIAVVLLVGLLSMALGVALGRFIWPAARRADAEALSNAQDQIIRLDHECGALRTRADQLGEQYNASTIEAKAAREDVATLTERVVGLMKNAEQSDRQISSLEGQRDQLAAEAKSASEEIARLKERENALSEKLEEQVAELADLHKQLAVEFENIANRILKANASQLTEDSQKTIRVMLDPLHDRIQDFQKKIETTYDSEAREVLSLKEQIRLVLETSHTIGSQADGLAKALRGDSQLLGRWGELALERILEAAGLTEGREYITQGRGLGLKNEAGSIQRPDVVVILPEQRTMIIDSKAPLASYERLTAAKDEAERKLNADQLVRDVKGHIEALAGKRYQENTKLQAHDCVLMFVPIEGALAAALTREPELFVYAWERHVVLVGPPTLLMTLRTVASIWRYELQGQNAQEIARLAGDLCDKLSSSVGDFSAAAEKIRSALETHNDAVKRLATGKGNALSIGERIRSLGVKTKKNLPAVVVDGVSIGVSDGSGQEAAESALVR